MPDRQIYSEVIYETQSPFVVPERARDRRMLEAAVGSAQCSFGLFDHGTGRAGFQPVLELHAEHASSCRPIEPVDEPTAGFVQRHCDAAPGRLEPASEVTLS
jgi:hypothetical protein